MRSRRRASSLGEWSRSVALRRALTCYRSFEGETHRLYELLDSQLAQQAQRGSQWVALDRPTIADFTFYPWVAIAGFGKIDTAPYKHVTKWLQTLQADKDVKTADSKLPK